jgi:hypothetical protein
VLDPCGCRLDAVATVLPLTSMCTVTCNDLDRKLAADTHMDATSPEFWTSIDSSDWVVGSPPFSHAPIILEHALKHANVGVAFKLRLSFIEPCANRVALLTHSPPTRLIVLPRAVYRSRSCGSSHDWITEAWLVWHKAELHCDGNISVVSREMMENAEKSLSFI